MNNQNEAPQRQPEESVLCTNCGSRNEVYGTGNRRKNCWYCKEPLIWTNPPQPSPIGEKAVTDQKRSTRVTEIEKELREILSEGSWGTQEDWCLGNAIASLIDFVKWRKEDDRRLAYDMERLHPKEPPPSPIGQESGLQKEGVEAPLLELVMKWIDVRLDVEFPFPPNHWDADHLIMADREIAKKHYEAMYQYVKGKQDQKFGELLSELSSLRSSLEEKQREIEGLKAERDDYKAALQTICDNSDNSWWTKDEQSLHKIVQEVLDKYPEQK